MADISTDLRARPYTDTHAHILLYTLKHIRAYRVTYCKCSPLEIYNNHFFLYKCGQKTNIYITSIDALELIAASIFGAVCSLMHVILFLNQSDTPPPPQAKLIVPNSTAGLIIGKGGATVKAVMEQSGAWVQLSQKPEGINLQERVVTVSGEPEQNRKAVEIIVQKIQEDPQSSSCLNISYSNITGPVANSNPTGSPFANSTEVLPNAAAAATASTLLGQAGLASMGGFPATMSSLSGNDLLTITSALNTLASYGYNTNTLGLGLNPAAASGVLAAVAASANPAAAAAANLLATYASEASGGGGHPAAHSLGGFSLGTLAAATGASNGYLNPSSPLVASSLLGTEKLAEGGKEVVEIAVPENLVGAILGKGGKTLVEYQELTGARIQISKKGEFIPGTRNRKVTITGSPAATQAAQYLISQRITYEQGVRATNPQKVG